MPNFVELKNNVKSVLQFFKKFRHWTRFTPKNQLWKFHHGLCGRFSRYCGWIQAFATLRGNWIAYAPTRSCDAMHRVRESKSNLELFHQYVVYLSFLSYFTAPIPEHVFESSLKLSLHIPKWLNAFQVLTWFSFLVTCAIFAHLTNTTENGVSVAFSWSFWNNILLLIDQSVGYAKV